MNPKFFPWLDYGGRLSPLKLAVFVALFVPALWAVSGYGLRFGDFGARPLMETIHQIGLWTIRLLLIALAIAPARQIFQWPRLLLVRRMVGVAAFAYAAAHFCLYMADQAFDLTKIVSEIWLRFYLTIGFVTLLGLAALAATSTDGMTRRLGGRNWQRLHRLGYGLAALALIHYFMQSKLDVWEPLVMAGFFAWLMLYRLLAWSAPSRGPLPVRSILLLGLVAGAATALGEAVYFWLAMGVDPVRVLGADLSLATGLRPGWVVLAAGLAVTLAAALHAALRPRLKLRLRFA